ncbi:MAG: hypothetical protein HYR60_10720, partial [Acidobacteria bacterium]|nr:hypothetical protein [Acidobacteriota bacterium]
MPVIRSEGLTELVGDVLLNCTGGTATPLGGTIPPVNVQIFMGTTVTSKLLTTGGLTEALLMLDEPGVNPNNSVQYPCYSAPTACAAVGNGAGFPTYYGGGTAGTFGNNKNVFQGQLAPGRNDSILWLGVPIDPPGTTTVRVIRITNVRINAN